MPLYIAVDSGLVMSSRMGLRFTRSPDLKVSVIVLNYNGAPYLRECLAALSNQSIPAENFEVILVDNGSEDESLELVREEFPDVQVKTNGRNLGFAAGNNAGIIHARGHYLALLNNDTRPEPCWIESLVSALQEQPKAGAATSKLLFYHDYVPVNFEVNWHVDDSPAAPDPFKWPIEIKVNRPWNAELELDNRSERGLVRWWGRMKLPAVPGRKIRVAVQVHAHDQFYPPQFIPQTPGIGFSEHGHRWVRPGLIEMLIDVDLGRSATRRLIQNAGSEVSVRGYGRDRGSYVANSRQYHHDDDGRYDQPDQVAAFCGAGVMLRRTAIENVGLFDESLFMYYEDTDLSWRLRSSGWDIIYQPTAVVRHVHCGTSGEWSPLFNYLVGRNRLLFVTKHFPVQMAASQIGLFIAGSVRMGLKGEPALRLRVRTLLGLVRHLSQAVHARHELNGPSRIPFSEMKKHLYRD